MDENPNAYTRAKDVHTENDLLKQVHVRVTRVHKMRYRNVEARQDAYTHKQITYTTN